MKVKELIEILKQQDPMKKVYLAADPEGNRFSELTGFTRNGLLVDGELHNPDDLAKKDPARMHEQVLVLWP